MFGLFKNKRKEVMENYMSASNPRWNSSMQRKDGITMKQRRSIHSLQRDIIKWGGSINPKFDEEVLSMSLLEASDYIDGIQFYRDELFEDVYG